jgi:hypothetical protein
MILTLYYHRQGRLARGKIRFSGLPTGPHGPGKPTSELQTGTAAPKGA